MHDFHTKTINNDNITPLLRKTNMSDEFDIMFESPCPCAGETMHWEWDDEHLYFEAECSCMKQFILRPITAEIEQVSEDFEHDDE